MLCFFVLNLGSVDWDSVDWCWCGLVSVMVVGWSMVVLWGSIVAWSVMAWSMVGLALGSGNSGEVEGFFVLDFGGVNWDSVHWCWGESVVS